VDKCGHPIHRPVSITLCYAKLSRNLLVTKGAKGRENVTSSKSCLGDKIRT